MRKAFAIALAIVLLASFGEASHLKEFPKKHKVVYHLSDPDRARFTLGNIQNHVDGVGGWQNIEAIELVVHGPALTVFAEGRDAGVRQALEKLQAQGLAFGACGNTMKAFNISKEQLPGGARLLPQGGVVRIMELQEQGYSYIRP